MNYREARERRLKKNQSSPSKYKPQGAGKRGNFGSSPLQDTAGKSSKDDEYYIQYESKEKMFKTETDDYYTQENPEVKTVNLNGGENDREQYKIEQYEQYGTGDKKDRYGNEHRTSQNPNFNTFNTS